jgi:hypothetical protein
MLGGYASLGNEWFQLVVGFANQPTDLHPQQRFCIDRFEIIHQGATTPAP